MTTLPDLSALAPLTPELFELAILDEATQCDMASCLPAFFRARRAAITGDPRQLRHLSFLPRERQRAIGTQWGLNAAELEMYDYREKSILDLMNDSIASQHQVAFLNEHFRSRPPIIAFSNRHFYQGNLKIMTSRPDTVRAPSLVFNVSITRARNAQFIFCSVRPSECPAANLLRQYLEEVQAPAAPAPSTTVNDLFLDEVRQKLEGLGYRAWPEYPVAGLAIDLLVERHNASFGIDLIGHTGPFARAIDLEKYRMFQRAGLKLFPLPRSAWRKNPQACLDAIQSWTADDTLEKAKNSPFIPKTAGAG